VIESLCERDSYSGGDLRLLTLRRIFFYRHNNIPTTFIENAGNRQFGKLPRYTPRSIPDILPIKDRYAIFLEVKTEKGKQSDDQVEFEQRAIEAGVGYAVVR
jgi:hypothetical protein